MRRSGPTCNGWLSDIKTTSGTPTAQHSTAFTRLACFVDGSGGSLPVDGVWVQWIVCALRWPVRVCVRGPPLNHWLYAQAILVALAASRQKGLLSPSPNLISFLILHESYSATFSYNLSLPCLALCSNELGRPTDIVSFRYQIFIYRA